MGADFDHFVHKNKWCPAFRCYLSPSHHRLRKQCLTYTAFSRFRLGRRQKSSVTLTVVSNLNSQSFFVSLHSISGPHEWWREVFLCIFSRISFVAALSEGMSTKKSATANSCLTTFWTLRRETCKSEAILSKLIVPSFRDHLVGEGLRLTIDDLPIYRLYRHFLLKYFNEI